MLLSIEPRTEPIWVIVPGWRDVKNGKPEDAAEVESHNRYHREERGWGGLGAGRPRRSRTPCLAGDNGCHWGVIYWRILCTYCIDNGRQASTAPYGEPWVSVNLEVV